MEAWFHSWYWPHEVEAWFNLWYWPQEAEAWFHSWYRGKVEMLNANMATLTKTSTQGNETLYQMYAQHKYLTFIYLAYTFSSVASGKTRIFLSLGASKSALKMLQSASGKLEYKGCLIMHTLTTIAIHSCQLL